MKAVLFDFNGTLYNDARFHIEAWRRFTIKYRHENPTDREIIDRFIGPNDETIILRELGAEVPFEERMRIAEEKESDYRGIAGATEETRRLIAGAPELFDKMKARGIPFAVATASYISNVRFYMNDLGLGRWLGMDRVVYEDGTLRGKPEPDFYLEAARRVNLPIGECVVCEDTRTGVEAARRAGAGKIIAIDSSIPAEDLRALPGVTHVIHSYVGIEEMLDIPELL